MTLDAAGVGGQIKVLLSRHTIGALAVLLVVAVGVGSWLGRASEATLLVASKNLTAASPSQAAPVELNSANLQKIQIVKGWADAGGETSERVFDVVCADGLEPDAQTHRCADNSARGDLSDCSYSSDAGSAELSTTWTDPTFDPSRRAFYYVRVLENPTCRWSTHRGLATNSSPPAGEASAIRERAWSSPIWYTPAVR